MRGARAIAAARAAFLFGVVSGERVPSVVLAVGREVLTMPALQRDRQRPVEDWALMARGFDPLHSRWSGRRGLLDRPAGTCAGRPTDELVRSRRSAWVRGSRSPRRRGLARRAYRRRIPGVVTGPWGSGSRGATGVEGVSRTPRYGERVVPNRQKGRAATARRVLGLALPVRSLRSNTPSRNRPSIAGSGAATRPRLAPRALRIRRRAQARWARWAWWSRSGRVGRGRRAGCATRASVSSRCVGRSRSG